MLFKLDILQIVVQLQEESGMTIFSLFDKGAEKFIRQPVANLCETNYKVTFNPHYLLLLLSLDLFLTCKKTFSGERNRRSHVFVEKIDQKYIYILD